MAKAYSESVGRKRPTDSLSGEESEKEKKALSPEKQEQRARNVLLHQIARSSKSTKQLRDILDKREIDPEIAETVLQRFTEVGLIDDLQFAETLVSSRRKFAGKSSSVIRRELMQKGISPEIITEVLSELTTEGEIELATALAVRRISQLARFDFEVRRRRLTGFLLRKGFSSAVVSQAVRHAESTL